MFSVAYVETLELAAVLLACNVAAVTVLGMVEVEGSVEREVSKRIQIKL